MVQLLHPRVLAASLVLLVAVIGCAHPKPAPAPMVYRPAPPPPPPPPPPVKKIKLVVLPLDKLALPGTADDLNAKLAQVRMPGAEDAVLATVSMETAQLQSECSEPTETCYLKIARLVEADRLLWAQVEKVSGKGKKKAKKPSTRIQIILFDREKLAIAGQSDETFAGPITGEDLDKLIVTATGVRPSLAGAPDSAAPIAASPPPAAAPQPAYAPAPSAYPAAAAPQPAGRPAYAPQPAPQPTQQPAPSAAPAARQPAAQPAAAPAPAGYRQPAAAPQPAYAQPAAATPPPPAYAPPAASPPPASAPPPPAYAPAPGSPPPASAPMPARWQ